MKSKISTILLLIIFSFTAHTQNKNISDDILDYVKSVLGKKVDRGECWDLVAGALDYANAEWQRPLDFGKKINRKHQELKAGDIMELLNITYDWGGKSSRHYAIIIAVIDENKLKIADQNVSGVRKVKIREYDLSRIKRGTINFYRPYR